MPMAVDGRSELDGGPSRRAARRRGAGVAVAAVLLLSGCGEEQSAQEAMVEGIRTSILRDETFAGYEVGPRQATCVAEATVAGIGVRRLERIGFDADEETADEVDLRRLRDDEVDVVGEAMEECIDDIDAVLVDTVSASILDDPSSTLPLDEGDARCVAAAVVEDIPASRLIAIGVRGDRTGDAGALRPAEVDVFASAYTGCIDVRRVLLDGIASAGTADDEVLACLDDQISDETIETLFRAGLAGEDTAVTARELLGPAVDACTPGPPVG